SGLLKLRRISDLGFEITDPLKPQPIFDFLQEEGDVEDEEMYRTFNMGMGFLVVLEEEEAGEACRIMGPGSRIIGSVVEEGLRAGHLAF
ncbi:AIR synthase-related protein, partial [Methanothrix sp.]